MKKIIIPIFLGLLLTSCTRGDINLDSNSAYTTIPSTLITFAQKNLSDYVTTPDVNTDNFRLTMQYWTETTYVNESNYDFTNRNVSDQIYSSNYVTTLNNLEKAKDLINAHIPTVPELATYPAVKANQLAIIDIMEVYTLQNLVDTFGNIPYSQALQLNSVKVPAYDDAATIYSSLITRLTTDINSMVTSQSSSLGAADLYYSGDVTKWKKFGSSVLLKLGLNLSDVNPALAQTTINKAISFGVMTSAADTAKLVYLTSSPNYSPLYANLVASNRNDYVGGKTLIDYMNASSDVRISKYYQPAGGGVYKGATIGAPAGFANFSAPGTFAYTTTTPGILLSFTEVQFYLAEVAARFNIGSAPALYSSAVTASFADWGFTAADAAAYLLTKPYDATNYKKSIGEQAWVAFYNQPLTSWNSWRRLDYPVLTAPATASPNAGGKVPVRMQYSTREASVNGANVAAAAAAIGGDKLTTKLFWDKF